MPVIAVTHPLVRHEVGRLRDPDLGPAAFRALTRELARLLAVEATADLPLEPLTVPCWGGAVSVDALAGRGPTVVSVLRAGLGSRDRSPPQRSRLHHLGMGDAGDRIFGTQER